MQGESFKWEMIRLRICFRNIHMKQRASRAHLMPYLRRAIATPSLAASRRSPSCPLALPLSCWHAHPLAVVAANTFKIPCSRHHLTCAIDCQTPAALSQPSSIPRFLDSHESLLKSRLCAQRQIVACCACAVRLSPVLASKLVTVVVRLSGPCSQLLERIGRYRSVGKCSCMQLSHGLSI